MQTFKVLSLLHIGRNSTYFCTILTLMLSLSYIIRVAPALAFLLLALCLNLQSQQHQLLEDVLRLLCASSAHTGCKYHLLNQVEVVNYF